MQINGKYTPRGAVLEQRYGLKSPLYRDPEMKPVTGSPYPSPEWDGVKNIIRTISGRVVAEYYTEVHQGRFAKLAAKYGFKSPYYTAPIIREPIKHNCRCFEGSVVGRHSNEAGARVQSRSQGASQSFYACTNHAHLYENHSFIVERLDKISRPAPSSARGGCPYNCDQYGYAGSCPIHD